MTVLVLRDHSTASTWAPEADAWNWRDDAKCRGRADLFIDVEPNPHARVLCHLCPVRADCLADAFATRALDDFRAGLTPAELRRAYRLRDRVVRCVCRWCGASFTSDRKRPYCCDTHRKMAKQARR